MGRIAIVVALALQACGPRSSGSEQPDASSASEREGNEGGENSGSAGTSPVAAPDCPARFDIAMHGGTCEQGGHCQYPEAECWCQGKQQCTGVDLGPEAQMWFEWSCRVSDSAVRRADGCPAKVPEQGHACEQDGQVCHYSPYCGGIQSTGRCIEKAWQLEQIEVSAPPSSEG
jgi:hypothetical protein